MTTPTTDDMKELNLETFRADLEWRDQEIAKLESKIASLKRQIFGQAVEAAKPIVAAAVKAGRLPSDDYALQAQWIHVIAGEPTLAQVLTADGGKADKEKAARILDRARELQKRIGISFAVAFQWATCQEECGTPQQVKAGEITGRATNLKP